MADPLDRFRDGLPDGFVPLSESLGWVSGRRGRRAVIPAAARNTDAAARAIDLLLDAAHTHLNGCA